MKHQLHRSSCSRVQLYTSLLALGCASGTLACSGDYPIGSMEQQGQLLDGEDASGGATAAAAPNASVGAVLPAPEVTIGLEDVSLPIPGIIAPVGDLDGDGFDDTAVSAWDFATRISYVQLRYGGPRPQTPVEQFLFDESGPRLIWGDDLALTQPMVIGAGDVDGDGYADLLIKSYECDQTDPREGAYLVYGGPERLSGSPSIDSIAARFVPPTRTAEEGIGIGCSGMVAGAPGDLDGDGLDDFVLTVTQVSNLLQPPRVEGDGAYVFYGSAERFSGEIPYASADAYLQAQLDLQVYPVGDVTGDGRAELLLGSAYPDGTFPVHGVFFVPGSSERVSGSVNLEQSSTLLGDLHFPPGMFPIPGGFDQDGDGTNDLLLSDGGAEQYLFYGRTDLFAEGVETPPDVTFEPQHAFYVAPAGDRDGDGDAELLSVFSTDQTTLSMDVALLSGEQSRLGATASFPEEQVRAAHPDGAFEDGYRTVSYAFPAGDLDGDGAGDLITLSALRYPDGTDSYQVSGEQLHIHYGVPAASTTPPLR